MIGINETKVTCDAKDCAHNIKREILNAANTVVRRYRQCSKTAVNLRTTRGYRICTDYRQLKPAMKANPK